MRLAIVVELGLAVLLVVLAIQTDPWIWWWTRGKPMPQVGEVWCRESDGDPWDRQPHRYVVLELREGWVRYGSGSADGWPSTAKLWVFRANYAPCS